MNLQSRLVADIERNKDELIKLLRELIQIPTVNPPGENYAECVRLLEATLKEQGIRTRVVKVPRDMLKTQGIDLPRPSLMAAVEGTDHDHILNLNGHYDVVPAGGGWSVDPFGAKVSDGKVFGRGASDMKGSVAALVMAANALQGVSEDLRGDLVVSLTPDEETGGRLGTGYLLSSGNIVGDYAIVAEGCEHNELALMHKGALWMDLEVHGKSAHASTPNLGVNAVTRMAEIIVGLNEYSRALEKRRTPSSKFFGKAPSPVLTVGGIIRGGTKVNIVPDYCACTIDRRLLPEERTQVAKKEILSVTKENARRRPRIHVSSRTVLEIPPSYCSPDSPVARKLAEAIEFVNGKPPKVVGSAGFTDAHYFSERMPTAMYGAETSARMHQADEYVKIDDVISACKVFALTASALLSRKKDKKRFSPT